MDDSEIAIRWRCSLGAFYRTTGLPENGVPPIPGFIISFPKWLELGFYPHFQTRISDQFLENLAELRQQIAMFRIKQPGVGIMTMTWYDAV